MAKPDCDHEYSIDRSGQGTCMVCGHLQFEETDGYLCDYCQSEQVDKPDTMCQGCDTHYCEECHYSPCAKFCGTDKEIG